MDYVERLAYNEKPGGDHFKLSAVDCNKKQWRRAFDIDKRNRKRRLPSEIVLWEAVIYEHVHRNALCTKREQA